MLRNYVKIGMVTIAVNLKQIHMVQIGEVIEFIVEVVGMELQMDVEFHIDISFGVLTVV